MMLTIQHLEGDLEMWQNKFEEYEQNSISKLHEKELVIQKHTSENQRQRSRINELENQ